MKSKRVETMTRPLAILPPVMFAGLAAIFYLGVGRDDPDALPSAIVESAAPPVNLAGLGDNEPFTDAALRNDGVKLVNFWASWCAPCRAEHPALERLAAEGVPVFGINYKDIEEDALAFLRELGNPYAGLGTDARGRTALDWGVYGIPETYVIDGKGTVTLRFAGPITGRSLAERIRPAMERAAAN